MVAHTILLVLGLYFMAAGTGLLVRPADMARMIDELEEGQALAFICGVFLLFLGGGLLSVQNSFASVADAIASFYAAAILVEGILLIAWPKPLWALARWMMPDEDHFRGFGLVAIALGLIVFALGAL